LPPAAHAAETGTHFANSKFHYEFTIPPKWNIDTPESGVPVLFNYKRSEGGPQGLFPDHGANIFLIPLAAVQVSTRADTISEWIQSNLQRDHQNASTRKKPELSSKSADGPQDVVEVQSDFTRAPGEDPQREVDYYFSLRSSAFRLLLLYWKDDTQGQHFQSIAETLLRTIRSH
jgi:hypothetical protein